MSDLINGRTTEEIITGLKCEVPCSKCAYRDHNFMKDDSCSYFVEQDIIALIQHLESERDAALAKVPKWISVKERLPDYVAEVLVQVSVHVNGRTQWKKTQIAMFIPPTKSWEYVADGHEVTHWMPLPNPPKEGE